MNFFSTLAHKIVGFFGSHHDSIQAGIGLAHTAATAALAVSAALGEDPSVIRVIAGISDGLKQVSATVDAESNAETLTDHAAALTGLASGLIQATNDIGIKNADTKAAIGAVLSKVNSVVGALEASAAAK